MASPMSLRLLRNIRIRIHIFDSYIRIGWKNGKSHIELQYVQHFMNYSKGMGSVKTFYSQAKLDEKAIIPMI